MRRCRGSFRCCARRRAAQCEQRARKAERCERRARRSAGWRHGRGCARRGGGAARPRRQQTRSDVRFALRAAAAAASCARRGRRHPHLNGVASVAAHESRRAWHGASICSEPGAALRLGARSARLSVSLPDVVRLLCILAHTACSSSISSSLCASVGSAGVSAGSGVDATAPPVSAKRAVVSVCCEPKKPPAAELIAATCTAARRAHAAPRVTCEVACARTEPPARDAPRRAAANLPRRREPRAHARARTEPPARGAHLPDRQRVRADEHVGRGRRLPRAVGELGLREHAVGSDLGGRLEARAREVGRAGAGHDEGDGVGHEWRADARVGEAAGLDGPRDFAAAREGVGDVGNLRPSWARRAGGIH